MIWWLIVAGGAGWTFDDWCGTPPRRGPIGPGPWWIRKVLAAAGGIAMFLVVGPQLGAEAETVLGAALLGGIGGVLLASIGSEVMGGRAGNG